MQTDQLKLHRNIDKISLYFLLLGLIITLYACNEYAVYKPKLNLCKNYSIQDLSDSLYVDTLIRDDWYNKEVAKIIEVIKVNCSDSKQMVYPFEEFDQVVYYNNSLELLGNSLNSKEIKQLVELINNPLNFEWGETTFEVDQLIIFKMNGNEVGRLEIMDEGIIKSQPDNVLMKAGALTKEGYKQFEELIQGL